MEKELLLAISDDRAASFNLRFLREVYTDFCDLKLTLFYVSPRPPGWVMDKKQFKPRDNGFDEAVQNKRAKGEDVLEDAARWIRDVIGCSGENVRTKVVHSKKGTVQELIDEARDGLYDALLLGRTGSTWFEEIFENSISHEMILRDIDFPVWVCRRPPDIPSPRHDVLLCMDGSKASLRMADHAAYMLADEPRHTFTLFHVSRDGLNADEAGRFFDQGLEVLAENGIAEERIELKMVMGKDMVKAIIKEATEGNYSAVGVGKRGADAPTTANGFFPSSVTVRLLRSLTDTALWISK